MRIVLIAITLGVVLGLVIWLVCEPDGGPTSQPVTEKLAFSVTVSSPDGVESELLLRVGKAEPVAVASGRGAWSKEVRSDVTVGAGVTASLLLSGTAATDCDVIPSVEQTVSQGTDLQFRVEAHETPPDRTPVAFRVRVDAPVGAATELVLVRAQGDSLLDRREGEWSGAYSYAALEAEQLSVELREPGTAGRYTIEPATQDPRSTSELAFTVRPAGRTGPVTPTEVEIITQSCRVRVTEGGSPLAGVQLTSDPAVLGGTGVTGVSGEAELALTGAKGSRFKVNGVTADGRQRATMAANLRGGAPLSLAIEYPLPPLTVSYVVAVTLDGASRANARVSPSAGGTTATTTGTGEARLTVTLEKGEELSFKAAFEGVEGRSGRIVHSSEAGASPVRIALVSGDITADYIARAKLDGRAYQGVTVRIIDRATNAIAGEQATDRKGIAKVQVKARRGAQLEAKPLLPESSGQAPIQLDAPPLLSHTAYPDTLRFTWETKPPPPPVTATYVVAVTLDGEARSDARVTPSSGGQAGTTGGSGEARVTVALGAGEDLTFAASYEGMEGRSGRVVHGVEAAASPIRIDLVSSDITANYTARATLDGQALPGVKVQIVDQSTGAVVSEKETDARGIARIAVRALPNRQLEARSLLPDLPGEDPTPADAPPPFTHKASPDELRFSWTKPKPPPPPPPPGPSTCEALDQELRAAVEDGWYLAFLLLKNLPGTYGTREDARQGSTVQQAARTLQGKLEGIGARVVSSGCRSDLQRDYHLASMLAAAAVGDVNACRQAENRFNAVPGASRSAGTAAASLYAALALTIKGVTDPAEEADEARRLLERCDRHFEQASPLIRAQIGGRRYGVHAALLWQLAEDPNQVDAVVLCTDAQEKLRRWDSWCANDPNCRDQGYLREMNAVIRCR